MPKSLAISCQEVANWHHVASAFHKAVRGKRQHRAVQQALSKPEETITLVRTALSQGRLPHGRFHSFEISDPKQRIIHAAPFQDRIAHHALIMKMEPVLERVLLPSVFACRPSKGVHKAIYYAQKQSRRFKWVVHIDIKHYFPNIDHGVLSAQLHRYFKGDGFAIIDSVINAYQHEQGKGLPIGSLTSQHFANHYLNQVDRWSLAQKDIKAHCRYRDDFLFWAHSKVALEQFLIKFEEYLKKRLKLTIKPALIQASKKPLLYCGIHIRPFNLQASARRQKRYQIARQKWALRWQQGQINSEQLQAVYASVSAILLPAKKPRYREKDYREALNV